MLGLNLNGYCYKSQQTATSNYLKGLTGGHDLAKLYSYSFTQIQIRIMEFLEIQIMDSLHQQKNLMSIVV